jgi:ATP-dependent DNA helicase RecQ
VLAQQCGRAILEALGWCRSPGAAVASSPRRLALEGWRQRVAREAGVPVFLVLGNTALEALVAANPRDARALARVAGLGPRALAKYGDALLRLIAATPSAGYLLPMQAGTAAASPAVPPTEAERPQAERRGTDRRR